MSTVEEHQDIKEELESLRKERDILKEKNVDLRLCALETDGADREKRLRIVEEVATKFNFLMFLSIGGGVLSIIVLGEKIFGM